MGATGDGVDRIVKAWLRERPGTPVGAVGIVTRIKRVAKLLEDDHRRRVHRLGIDAATRDLLSTLRRAGPPYRLGAGELARLALLSTGAISQRVARAENLGLVRRARAETDARTVLVELTTAGHALIERTVDDIFRHEQDLLAGLTAQQQHELTALLRILLANLSERLDVPDWP